MIEKDTLISKKELNNYCFPVSKDPEVQVIINTNSPSKTFFCNEDFSINSKYITPVASPYTVYSGIENIVSLFKREIDSSFLGRI